MFTSFTFSSLLVLHGFICSLQAYAVPRTEQIQRSRSNLLPLDRARLQYFQQGNAETLIKLEIMHGNKRMWGYLVPTLNQTRSLHQSVFRVMHKLYCSDAVQKLTTLYVFFFLILIAYTCNFRNISPPKLLGKCKFCIITKTLNVQSYSNGTELQAERMFHYLQFTAPHDNKSRITIRKTLKYIF